MAAGDFAQELCQELTCCICLEYFTNPVTIHCEHSFCQACLTKSWEVPGKNISCPLCRQPASEWYLKPNRQLANIVEISKEFSLQVAEGAGGVCERHQEPLKLFCRDDKAPMCVECHKSELHREHRVIPVEEAVVKCQKKVQALVERKIQTLVGQEKTEKWMSQRCLKRLAEKKQEITSALEEMHRFVQEKQHFWMRQLAGLEEEIKRRLEENMTRLSKETSHFSSLIKDVELQSQKPPCEFLQHLGNILSRCQKRTMKLEPSPVLEWRLRSHTLKISLLKKHTAVLEGSLTQELNKVSVTLDPDTAHPSLVLSEDLKRVRCGSSEQRLPFSSLRFDVMPCVLGTERFTTGRHYWEVEVEKLDGKDMWAVGVAVESLTRKGWIFACPSEGVWAVGTEVSQPHEILAFTCLRVAPVALTGEPKKIRVFLDYEKGRVEFFNADTDDLIFTFPSVSFRATKVRPFFYVGASVSLNCGI